MYLSIFQSVYLCIYRVDPSIVVPTFAPMGAPMVDTEIDGEIGGSRARYNKRTMEGEPLSCIRHCVATLLPLSCIRHCVATLLQLGCIRRVAIGSSVGRCAPALRHCSAGAMASASAAPPTQPQSLTGLAAAEEYIAQHHRPGVSWHITLNSHASTRPKEYGGSLVHSVQACKTFQQTGGGDWSCNVDVPNSFAPGDGYQLHGEGQAKQETRRRRRHAGTPWRSFWC